MYSKSAEGIGPQHFWRKDLATTYSRGVYKTTTIGKAVFDGRVRDGNGSGHSFMVTKKRFGSGVSLTGQTSLTRRTHHKPENVKEHKLLPEGRFSENYIQAGGRKSGQIYSSLRYKSLVSSFVLRQRGKKAIKPHDRLVLVR